MPLVGEGGGSEICSSRGNEAVWAGSLCSVSLHRLLPGAYKPAQINDRSVVANLLISRAPDVTNLPPAIAIIDGVLCRVSRTGAVMAQHAPLATAVLEFQQGPLRLYVREHPYGLLPGVPNIYCLDPNFRLLWLAEWPYADDPCARLAEDNDNVLVTPSVAGATVRLDAMTGRLIDCASPMAAAS